MRLIYSECAAAKQPSEALNYVLWPAVLCTIASPGGDMDDSLKKAKEKAAATYDAAADHFDDEPLGFWELIGKRTVSNLNLQVGAKVLDVGCGTGASVLPAAQTVGKAGAVVGIDLSSRLLERARAKALTAGLDNIEFRRADMTAL